MYQDCSTYSTPFFFLSAASSRCRCSMLTFSFVASENSLFIKLSVTVSHNFLLSLACCFSNGLTTLGITSNPSRSSRGVQSSPTPDTSALENEAAGICGVGSFTWDGLGDDETDRVTPAWSEDGYEPVPTRFQRIRPRQEPSNTATTRF